MALLTDSLGNEMPHTPEGIGPTIPTNLFPSKHMCILLKQCNVYQTDKEHRNAQNSQPQGIPPLVKEFGQLMAPGRSPTHAAHTMRPLCSNGQPYTMHTMTAPSGIKMRTVSCQRKVVGAEGI